VTLFTAAGKGRVARHPANHEGTVLNVDQFPGAFAAFQDCAAEELEAVAGIVVAALEEALGFLGAVPGYLAEFEFAESSLV
jgi:hypothetical protein